MDFLSSKDNEMLRRVLQNEPFFWSRLGFCYDPPRADADGNQIIFSREYDEYRRVHRDFADAGVKFHTTILHSGWVGANRYDYRLTDEILDAVFDGNPDIYYMPRVKLNVPPDWCRENPEDTFVYFHGPRTAPEIAALAETPRHDYFGMESDGYVVNGGKGVWIDDRPNKGGLIGLQSFSSEKWKADASVALRKLLEHLAASGYADRIIGVHIAYGMCGETHPFGLWAPIGDGRRGDFGIQAQRDFAQWGIDKYGDAQKRDGVWGDPLPPDPWVREGFAEHFTDLFCPENAKLHDYFLFCSEINARAIETFCDVVKGAEALFGHKLAAGAFYGYAYKPWAANAGHLGIEQILNAQSVDFLSAPKGYYRCLAGDPGGEQGPSESIARRRVWLDEIDNWTHLDRRPGNNKAKNESETKTLLWREAVKNLTHGQGFWWMDLGEGWYDTPALMEEIRCITDLQRKKGAFCRSAAEILLVVDENAVSRMKITRGLNTALMFELHSELKLTGAVVDTLRLADLWDADLSMYKMVVFSNCFLLSEQQRKALLGILDGKFVVWHYASGILSPDFDPDSFTALTGFVMKPIEKDEGWNSFFKDGNIDGDFPVFTVDAPDEAVLTRHPDGTPNCVRKGKVCLCCTPVLTRDTYRELAKQAGVAILCDGDCTVYADDRLAGFFPKQDFRGNVTLPDGTSVPAEIPAHGMAVFAGNKRIR